LKIKTRENLLRLSGHLQRKP